MPDERARNCSMTLNQLKCDVDSKAPQQLMVQIFILHCSL